MESDAGMSTDHPGGRWSSAPSGRKHESHSGMCNRVRVATGTPLIEVGAQTTDSTDAATVPDRPNATTIGNEENAAATPAPR